MSDTAGLYGKYVVERVDGRPIDWCFVLELDDLLARRALALYAELTEARGNTGLADDLREKIRECGGTEDEGVLTSRDMIAVYAQQAAKLRQQVARLEAALMMLSKMQTSWWLIRLESAKRAWEQQKDNRTFWNSLILEREDVTRRVAYILACAALKPHKEE